MIPLTGSRFDFDSYPQIYPQNEILWVFLFTAIQECSPLFVIPLCTIPRAGQSRISAISPLRGTPFVWLETRTLPREKICVFEMMSKEKTIHPNAVNRPLLS